MSLLLVSSECKFLDSIISSIKEDTNYIIVNKFETSESFRDKLSSSLNLSSIDLSQIINLGLVFDNTGNRAPFFELTEEELTPPVIEREKIYSLNEDGETVETEISGGNNFIPVSSFINSGKFFSNTLLQEIANIKAQAPLLTNVDIISNNALTIESIHEELNLRYEDNQMLYFNTGVKSVILLDGPKAVPLSGKIYTSDELFALMETTNLVDLSRDYELMNDIDMTGYQSRSIGRATYPFRGNFNGNGYTITINETLENNYFGLFQSIGNLDILCNIANLNLKYLNNGFGISIEPDFNILIGGLCGIAIKTIFENCNIEYTQDTTLFGNYDYPINRSIYVSGFIGGTNVCQIRNCNLVSNGNLNINVNPTINSSSVVAAGFIGELYVSSSLVNSSCLVKGDLNININKNISTSNNFIGGFIGNISSDLVNQINLIKDCSFEVEGDCDVNYNLSSISTNFNYIGGAIGQNVVSNINNFNCIFHKNVKITSNSPNNRNYISGFIGNVNISSSLNLYLKVFGNIDVQVINSNQTTQILNVYIGGIFGFINSTSLSNCNFNTQDINVSYNNAGYPLYLSGLIGYIQNSTASGYFAPCNLDNLVFNVKNINLKWTKTGTIETGNVNIGGGFGQINNSPNAYLNNFTFICDNLTIDIDQLNANTFSNLRVGALSGTNFNISEANSNMCINDTYTLNLNINDNGTSVRNLDIGGVYGFIGTVNYSNFNYTSQNCTFFINKYIQNNNITAVNPSSLIISNGGMIGRCSNIVNTPYTLDNFTTFFGSTAIIQSPTDVAYTFSISGGVVGNIDTSGITLNNCVAVYNNYTIDGNVKNAIIGSNTGTANNIRSISYGSPITSSGVQDMSGPETTSDIIDIFNTSVNTQFYTYLLNLRQNIGDFTPSQNLYSILNSSSLTPLVFRNAAIQNSMYFIGLNEIKTDYGTIKSSLSDYSLSYSDLTPVYYITSNMNTGIYTLSPERMYYLFNPFGKINIPSYSQILDYNSNVLEGGVEFNETFTGVNKVYELPNEGSIKVAGVGSALVQVNSPPAKDSNWWWITIIIVIGVILLIFFLYYAIRRYWGSGTGNLGVVGSLKV